MAAGKLQLPPQQATAGQPVRLAPRPPVLAGREELLTQLDARLSGGDDPAPRTVVLCGLGGAGKTSVAVEYAHRHLAEVGVAWQFAAADATVLAAGFAELAAQLGARGLADARDPVASVHAVLARFPAPWLLVFDNAPSRASVQAFLPPTGRGRVLITSRDQTWPPGQPLEVPVLDQQVAAGFLANRTGDTNGQAAWDLAGELGGLPLALEQAAAYIQASGGSLAGYLALFRQRRADMLGRGELIGYPETVATTWRLAFGELERSAPSAVGLLRLLACCAPEAVPLPLLFQRRPGLAEERGVEVSAALVPLLEDPLVISDAVAALRRYSLVTLAGGGSVSVHRLVQAVTADQMPADMAAEWRQVAADLIEAAIPDDAERPETWPVFEALLPHAQVALADDRDGIDQLAGYLGYRGSYASALELERRFRDALERSPGPGHRRTLAARVHFAYWTGRAGDAATARDQDAALLPMCERVFGPEHSETLAARTNLARWTGEAGDAAGARDQSVALLSVCERVFGPEHPQTLSVRIGLARWTGEAGGAAAARDQFVALLPVCERALGPEHLWALGIRTELARWTGRAGDAAAARDQYAGLLPVRERVLGPEHPGTLNTRDNLARWTGEAGDAAGARDQYAALLPVIERVFGPEHPETEAVREELGYWTTEVDSDVSPGMK